MRYIPISIFAFSILASFAAGANRAAKSSSKSTLDFCAPQASEAAKALAKVNGTASSSVTRSKSKDGRNFTVVLSEKDVGEDTYHVSTGGEHDCTVYSMKVKGQPSRRP